MGQIREPDPVNLVCPALAAKPEWLDAARAELECEFGSIDMESATWPWEFTHYYEAEMGAPLLRRIYSFADTLPADRIVEVKLTTNQIEGRLAAALDCAVNRPVNLDPGYVNLAKMVLATTKDYAHRLYLGDGIYAESTLKWRDGQFQPWEWTYSDYRTERYRDFFAEVREAYRLKLSNRKRFDGT